MKFNSWNECIEFNSALRITPDRAKSNSLVETAKSRSIFLKKVSLNEESANFIFEGYYSSLIELLHSIVILKGYNVDNHVCLGFYIRDVLKDDKLYDNFDDVRRKRNFLVYYGKMMEFEVAKEAIMKTRKVIDEVLKH